MAGSLFYGIKKFVYWNWSGVKFARVSPADELSHSIFTHQTILLRELKDVDMYLQYNKIANLKIAIKNIDGAMLRPGETFSYWKLIGKPNKHKGYLPGMILQNGEVKTGVGGGLCQLSNLIYWMTLHTSLTVVERWRHGFDVFPDANRKQPFGSGATCSYPNVDLQIKNNTNQSFQLRLKVTETQLVGEWLSEAPLNFKYEIEERDHHIDHEWWGGYSRNNTIIRIKYNLETGEKIDEEMITENHAVMMYAPLLEKPS